VLRALSTALFTIWLAVTLSFFLLRAVPGNAVEAQLLQGGASRARIAEVNAALGLNEGLPLQYVRYLGDLIQGDLGYSLSNGRSVNTIIAERLRPTVQLALAALCVAVPVGLGLGILASGHGLDARLSQLAVNLSLSMPIYWTGTLVIILFAAQLQWLPATGSSGVRALILPVGVLAFHTMGEIARMTQANVRSFRAAPHVLVARSRGLTRPLITLRYILRPALLPVISVIALQAGFLIGGAVITETLFVRPGIGRLLLESTLNQDYTVVQGVVVLATLVYVSVNTLADLAYRLVDPRVYI